MGGCLIDIFLRGFAYEVGERRKPVCEVPELVADERLRHAARELGLEYFCETSRAPLELVVPAARRSLEMTGTDPADVDTVVYATSTFSSAEYYSTQAVSSFLMELGLKNAYPVGTFLSGCGNVMTALRLGEALIRSRSARTVLVAVSDVRRALRSPFIHLGASVASARDGWTVTSDGAGTLLMGADPPRRGAQLYGVRHHILGEVGVGYGTVDPVSLLIQLGRGFRISAHALLSSIGWSIGDVDVFLGNTMHARTTLQLGKVMGFAIDKLYLANVAAYGHIRGGTDIIAALADLSAAGRLTTGSKILSLGNGHTTWGVAAMTAIEDTNQS